MPHCPGRRACGSICDPLTSSSVTVLTASVDIWDPHLHHTILLRVSPKSFKNCTPTSGSLNRNAKNNFLEHRWRPELRARTSWYRRRLGIEATTVRFSYGSNTYVRHRCYKCKIFVRKRKRIIIIKQHSTSEQEPKRYWRQGRSPEGKETL